MGRRGPVTRSTRLDTAFPGICGDSTKSVRRDAEGVEWRCQSCPQCFMRFRSALWCMQRRLCGSKVTLKTLDRSAHFRSSRAAWSSGCDQSRSTCTSRLAILVWAHECALTSRSTWTRLQCLPFFLFFSLPRLRSASRRMRGRLGIEYHRRDITTRVDYSVFKKVKYAFITTNC